MWPWPVYMCCEEVRCLQVGDTAQELSLWDRPEDMNHTRPSFSVNPEVPGADVMAHTAAALAAASAVLGGQDALYAEQLLNAAQSLYRLASANEGLSSSSAAPNATVGSLYMSQHIPYTCLDRLT